MATLHHRSDGIHSPRTANHIPLVHPPPVGIQHVPSQHAPNPLTIPLRSPTPTPDLGVQEAQRARHRIEHEQFLDLPVARRARHDPRLDRPMDPLRAAHRPTFVSILPRHPRRVERDKLQLGPHARRVRRLLQYVRAVGEHHRVEHLPRKRPATVPPG